MKQNIIFFRLFCKRILKKPAFLLLIIAIPFISIWLKNAFTIDNINLKVCIYCENKDELTANVINSLTSTKDTITFVECKNEQDLYDLVTTGKCQCGYIFPSNLEMRLDKFKFRHSIEVVTGTYNISSMTNEMVYAGIFKEYSLHLLSTYMKDTKLIKKYSEDELDKILNDMYRIYLSNGSTYSFKYTNDKNVSKDSSVLLPGYLILSVRGLLSILIFVVSLAGGIQLYTDRENGILKMLSIKQRLIPEFLVILSPTLLVAASCQIGIFLSGHCGNIIKELLATIMYVLVLSTITYIITCIISSRRIYCSFLPVIVICSLVICPVFVDISEFSRYFYYAKYIFAPTWYLNFFSWHNCNFHIYSCKY